MLKLIAAIRRKPGLTHEDCIQHLRLVHAPLARARPLGVKKYVQSFVFDGAYGQAGDSRPPLALSRDSVTELWFDSLETMGRTFADPYSREVIGPDGRNFSDLRSAIGLLTRETVIQAPRSSKTAIKVMLFVRLADETALTDLSSFWLEAHNSVMSRHRAMAKALRGLVQAIRAPEGDAFLAYFGGEDADSYHGVMNYWFGNDKALSLFRAYHADIARAAAEHIDHSRSFFVYTRENIVMDRI